jgi:hypothetical protein
MTMLPWRRMDEQGISSWQNQKSPACQVEVESKSYQSGSERRRSLSGSKSVLLFVLEYPPLQNAA